MHRYVGRKFDRRRGPDILLKLLSWTKFVVWGLVLAILFFISSAEPQFETFFDRLFDVNVRRTWNLELLQRAVYLTILVLFICICALIINSRRKRRKDDRYSITLILWGIISLMGIVVYYVKILY